MNRFDRITAILIQLQSRKVVKAQDIAQRFDISLRTVYRDIRSLEEAGVPLIGEAGVGYSLVDGYRLPPVMFTREEAISFLTAEKLVRKFTDTATQKRFESALYKIKSVLKSTEKDLLENMEGHIEVFQRSSAFHAATDNTLEVLLKCISEKKIAHITYQTFSSGEIKERDIEPIGIFHENKYLAHEPDGRQNLDHPGVPAGGKYLPGLPARYPAGPPALPVSAAGLAR